MTVDGHSMRLESATIANFRLRCGCRVLGCSSDIQASLIRTSSRSPVRLWQTFGAFRPKPPFRSFRTIGTAGHCGPFRISHADNAVQLASMSTWNGLKPASERMNCGVVRPDDAFRMTGSGRSPLLCRNVHRRSMLQWEGE